MTPGKTPKHKRIVRIYKTQTGGRDSADRDTTTHFVQTDNQDRDIEDIERWMTHPTVQK